MALLTYSAVLLNKQTAGLLLRSWDTRDDVSNQQFINVTGAVSSVYAKYIYIVVMEEEA